MLVYAVLLSANTANFSSAQPPTPSAEATNEDLSTAEKPDRLVDRTLIVGTKVAPPFAMKNSDGEWTGISVELWRHLADKLNLDYEFRELSLPEMFDQLEGREIDAAVAAISVTADRLDRVEFCHPHYATGLGVAVSARNRMSPTVLFRRILSTRLVSIVVVMVSIIAFCGFLFWLFERRRNEATFGTKRRQGIGMGVWWSMILLLGHKGIVPVTAFGRLLAATAMLLSILLMSLLTGVITSVITIQQLDIGLKHPTDLRDMRVATVPESTSADYLRQRRIPFKTYDTLETALNTLDVGRADAVVYDEALLKYVRNETFREVVDILPISFNLQEYAIALQPESNLRKPVNGELLTYRASDDWEDLIFRFLGE